MDLERNAVREAELRRKQEVRKEALTAHDKEIWNREMQVSFILLKTSVVDPDQIKIRIWIEIYKLDPDPDLHQFADVKLKCMKYEPVLALFQGFDPFFKTRNRIRIKVMVIHNTV